MHPGTCAECTCKCTPVYSHTGQFDFVFRLGILHIFIETILVCVTLLISQLAFVLGISIFLASLISLIGASIAVCCCPSYIGWAWNVFLHSLAFTIRFIIFLYIVIVLIVYDVKRPGGLIAFIACMLVSSSTGFPFWILARKALRSMPILPGDIACQVEAIRSPPDMATVITTAVIPQNGTGGVTSGPRGSCNTPLYIDNSYIQPTVTSSSSSAAAVARPLSLSNYPPHGNSAIAVRIS